jgi:hypothetical protein
MNQCCQIIAGQLVCLEWLVHDGPKFSPAIKRSHSRSAAPGPFKATCRWDRFLIEHDVEFGATETLSRLHEFPSGDPESDRPIIPCDQSFGEVLQLAYVPGHAYALRTCSTPMSAPDNAGDASRSPYAGSVEQHRLPVAREAWNVNLDDVQTDAGLTENARVDAFTQIAVGGRIRRTSERPVTPSTPIVWSSRSPQISEDGLHPQAHLAEFVEEQCRDQPGGQVRVCHDTRR